MKTINKQLQIGLNGLLLIHSKTSSWVAQKIGPVVFNYGTKEKPWNITTAELLKFPQDTLGKALGEFLNKNKIEPLAKAEYHDVQHVLFDYTISFKDEVALQFFLHGNGKKSIASVTTIIGAWFILPFHWKYLKASYKRGKSCKDISMLTLQTLTQNIYLIKDTLFPNVLFQNS